MIEQASLVLGNGNWAVKSDSLLGYKTIDGKYYPREMTFTRATTGTRVNEAGLVELVPYNFVQYSQEFENAYWDKYNTTITANNAVAPDGTTSADRLVLSGTSADSRSIYKTAPIVTATTTVTFSTFVKYVDKQYIQLVFSGGFSLQFANFDLINGTVTNGTYVSANVQSYANGWYRISITTTSSNTNCLPFIWAIDTALALRASDSTSTGTSAYLIWGAQIVDGTQPLDYLPTTDRLDIARIDYSTGSPALLLEPQRTNLLTYSSQFENSAWIKVGATVTANNILAPDGTMTADRVVFGAASNYIYQQTSSTATTANKSIYIKGTAGETISLDDTWVLSPSNLITLTGDWQRVNFTSTTTTGQGQGLAISTYQSATARTIYVWGAQLEVGSYPTSYIPTTSASVTRNADSVSKTGITSLIGQQEGTVFFDGVINGCDNPSANLINTERNTTASFGIGYVKASSQIGAFIYYGGSYIGVLGASIAIGQRAKIAFAYKSGNTTLYVNGVQIGTDTTPFTFPASLDDIFIGDPVTYFAYQESITNNATVLYKERLSNSELATLTTL